MTVITTVPSAVVSGIVVTYGVFTKNGSFSFLTMLITTLALNVAERLGRPSSVAEMKSSTVLTVMVVRDSRRVSRHVYGFR